MGMEHDWGYSTRHYYSLKHSYGTPEDLKRFIDECHGRHIRVILDGVYTFTNTECPLLKIDRDYWVKEFYTTEKFRKKTKNIRTFMKNHHWVSFLQCILIREGTTVSFTENTHFLF
jgi:1,4-alpha-glucan branching enzyme